MDSPKTTLKTDSKNDSPSNVTFRLSESASSSNTIGMTSGISYLIIPYPMEEGKPTRTVIPPGLSEEIIEQALSDYTGKAEIIDGEFIGDMSECDYKNALATVIAFAWGHHMFVLGGMIYTGTRGISFRHGAYVNTLSPDVSIAFADRENLKIQNINFHMRQVNAAPNVTMEVEWREEAYQADKGERKILDKFLSNDYIGLQNTRVDEGWLIVCSQNNIPNYMPMNEFIPLTDATPAVPAQAHRPVDAHVPYIAIYSRNNPEAIMYFPISYNTKIVIPPESVLFPLELPPLDCNYLLKVIVTPPHNL